jgi:bifunctional oligoribonuclease and PAP phosphatase NrnA
MIVPREVIDALTKAKAPVVISHVVPDADALGSMLAMSLAFTATNRHAKASVPPASISQRLAFLLDWAKVPAATKEDFAAADAFIVLDTAKKDRCNVGSELRETDWSAGRPIINIDHHSSNTRFGSTNWIDATAASTCEMVYYLLRETNHPITPTLASLLYAGILTDTLGFSLPTTTASSLRAAADLAELRADVGDLGERLGRSQRKSEFDLLRVIYDNTRLVGDGSIAYSSASYDEIRDAGCTAADIDEQINVPRSLDGVRLAMLFSEGRKDKTRINFRGSGNVTVLDLAAEFGGGGHSQAAGAILDCPLQPAIDKVLPRAIQYISRFQRKDVR